MNKFTCMVVMVSGVVGGQSLFAQEEYPILEEIIVTAQKREQSLQDVPVSVNAVSGTKLVESGTTNLENLTAYTPNFSMNQTGIGSTITVRGISSGINQGFEQSVGMYVDGIHYGRAQLSRAPLLDMERVEILRGPQTILFGKNSVAGAVSMVTAKPTEEFEGSITALYEPEHDEQDYRLVLSGPLSDSLSGRLAVLYRQMDGYMENTLSGQDEKDEEESVIRASLRWDATENLSFFLKADRTDFDVVGRNIEVNNSVALPTGGVDHLTVLNGLQALFGRPAVDGDLDYVRDSNGDTSNNEVDNYTLEVEYLMGEHTLNLTSGWAEYDYQELCDCDFTGAQVFLAFSDETYEQFSQEIRLTSPLGNTFEYIGGLYYQTSEMMFEDFILVPTDSLLPAVIAAANPSLAGVVGQLAGAGSSRNFAQDTDIWSAFFQVTWNLSPTFRLTLGGRYTDEQKEAFRRQFHVNAAGMDVGSSDIILNTLISAFAIEPYDRIDGDRDETAFTPLVNLQWDATENVMLYATWTTGFKSGGFDVRSNGNPDPAVTPLVLSPIGVIPNPNSPIGTFEFEEEKASSYELGMKTVLLEGAAELNVALYRTNYEDLQVSQFDGVLGFNVTNAGQAKVQGIEADGRWLMAPGFTLSGSLAYLDFEFEEFPNSQCYFGQPDPDGDRLCDAAGARKEYTPEWRATLSGDYSRALGDTMELRMVVDVIYVDDYLWNPTLDPRNEQDAYTKVNARLAFGDIDGRWEAALVGRNLTDRRVINYGGDTPLATTLTQGTGNSYYSFVGRPRSVALQFTWRF